MIYIYIERERGERGDLALNDLQWLICLKIQPNQTKPNPLIFFFQFLFRLVLQII